MQKLMLNLKVCHFFLLCSYDSKICGRALLILIYCIAMSHLSIDIKFKLKLKCLHYTVNCMKWQIIYVQLCTVSNVYEILPDRIENRERNKV